MAAIPMPRKMSEETYDVDGFIDKLLASRKFDKLTELFADKTAYKIKTLDTIPINIEKKRSSKKHHENFDSESNSGQARNPLLIDLPDEAHKEDHRKLNPTVFFKDGDILPNEDLSLKYKYLTRNAKNKNNSGDSKINKLKTKYKYEEHSPINNENHETFIELKKESENKIIADQNHNESNTTVENNHGDGYEDINHKSKTDHESVNEEHENTKEHSDLKDPEYSQLHGDDSENDANHSKTEHYAGPEFKTKIDSSEHEAANNNTPTAISEENLRDVISDEKTPVMDVTPKSTVIEENIEIQNLTTTHRIEETVTTSNTGREIHADNDMMGTPHFRTHMSEESDQTSNELRYPPTQETNHIEIQKLNEKLGQDKTYTSEPKKQEKAENSRADTQEKERRERAKMEKIIKDRLQEEERLQKAAANYEKKEREKEADRKRKKEKQKIQPSGEEIETKLRENAEKYKIQAKWVNEKLNYEKMLMEEAEKEEKAVREKGNELIKERLQYEKMLKNDAEKQERADIEREIKQRHDFEKEGTAKGKKWQREQEKKFIKEKTEFKKQLKEKELLAAKLEKERLEQLAKEKENYVKKLQEQYSEYEDETDEEKRKDIQKDVVSLPHARQEKKKPSKETQTLKDVAYKDNTAVELLEEKFSKEKQMQFRAQTLENSNNKLYKDVTDENVSSDESEVPTQKKQYVKASLQTNNQLNVENKRVEDEHNNQGTESESDNEDQRSGNEGLTTIDPNMMRREGDKLYAFVQDPEYAEYQEAYAKMQKEHPYNPADFM